MAMAENSRADQGDPDRHRCPGANGLRTADSGCRAPGAGGRLIDSARKGTWNDADCLGHGRARSRSAARRTMGTVLGRRDVVARRKLRQWRCQGVFDARAGARWRWRSDRHRGADPDRAPAPRAATVRRHRRPQGEADGPARRGTVRGRRAAAWRSDTRQQAERADGNRGRAQRPGDRDGWSISRPTARHEEYADVLSTPCWVGFTTCGGRHVVDFRETRSDEGGRNASLSNPKMEHPLLSSWKLACSGPRTATQSHPGAFSAPGRSCVSSASMSSDVMKLHAADDQIVRAGHAVARVEPPCGDVGVVLARRSWRSGISSMRAELSGARDGSNRRRQLQRDDARCRSRSRGRPWSGPRGTARAMALATSWASCTRAGVPKTSPSPARLC